MSHTNCLNRSPTDRVRSRACVEVEATWLSYSAATRAASAISLATSQGRTDLVVRYGYAPSAQVSKILVVVAAATVLRGGMA